MPETTPQPDWTEQYRRFERPLPEWFRDAKLGIFVHWGPYAVPGWAEPIGALGTIPDEEWFAHVPYAEWYANTIRIDGSPAQQHHLETYGGAPYDEFLDAWHAERFDADDFLDLVAATGARYIVPTTKHHDGVTLWDAPGTGDRNTVRRGPHRDLVGEFAAAARARGLRFGTYYSGGLDWHLHPAPPIVRSDMSAVRPVDADYARAAHAHVADLIERYAPDILWGDIEWPDAGKEPGPFGLADLFDRFYAAAPDGVVNDRFGRTHWDFRTSEYEAGLDNETSGAWENCRGIGWSFGYNRMEDGTVSLDGPAAVRHLLDVVSRGGNLLLNVGPTAAGEIPEVQRRTLEGLAAFTAVHGAGVFGSRPLDPAVGAAADEPWIRWTEADGAAHAFVVSDGTPVVLPVDVERVDLAAASAIDAPGTTGARVESVDGRVVISAPASPMPLRVVLPLR